MKYYYLIKEDSLNDLLNTLVIKSKIPEIKNLMNLYISVKNDILEISFVDGLCFVRFYGDSNKKTKITKISEYKATKPILIENKNIKFFLGTLLNLGLNKTIINTANKTKFVINSIKYTLLSNTLSGDMLVVEIDNGGKTDQLDPEISKHIKSKIDIKEVDKKIYNGEFKEDVIFDDLGNINPQIKEYMDKFGIDSSLNSGSIQSNLASKSNNYFLYNELFRKIFKRNIYSVEEIEVFKGKISPISIIIPSYNSNDTILLTLESINSQNIRKSDFKKIEVIVVDDGSDIPVNNLIKKEYKFKLNIIRLEENKGRSHARNIGGYSSLNNHLIFIDSDVLLANNFLFEHSMRVQSIPKSIFLSLKNNIKKSSSLCNINNIKKGLDKPKTYNDKRLFREIKKDKINLIKSDSNGFYELISDTGFLSNFGYGRIINGYDLASLVVSHNLSISRDNFFKTGGFSTEFKGWGLEDTYFGAKLISEGFYVIPILSTGVYHIDHPTRSVSDKEQENEYKKNIIIYNKLINKKIW